MVSGIAFYSHHHSWIPLKSEELHAHAYFQWFIRGPACYNSIISNEIASVELPAAAEAKLYRAVVVTVRPDG